MEGITTLVVFAVIFVLLRTWALSFKKRKEKNFRRIAESLRLTLEDYSGEGDTDYPGRDWKELYGEETFGILPGKEKKVQRRLTGIMAGVGEFCEVECSAITHHGTGAYLGPRGRGYNYDSEGNARRESFDTDIITRQRISCVIFPLEKGMFKDFNVSSESIADMKLYQVKNGALSNLFTDSVLACLEKIPYTSVAFSAGMLVFYAEDVDESVLQEFIVNSSQAASAVLTR